MFSKTMYKVRKIALDKKNVSDHSTFWIATFVWELLLIVDKSFHCFHNSFFFSKAYAVIALKKFFVLREKEITHRYNSQPSPGYVSNIPDHIC